MNKETEITNALYEGYASDYGVLFGIPSNCKEAVRVIVRLTIEKVNTEKKDILQLCYQALNSIIPNEDALEKIQKILMRD